MTGIEKTAKWIGTGDCCGGWQAKVLPAPFLRRTFNWTSTGSARISICGLGYYELYLNGHKVGDHVLDPVVTQYDERVRYVVYDVTACLQPGENVIGVILGNGWYNCHTPDVWHFDKASWRAYPKLWLQLEADEQIQLVSDANWKWSFGPIIFDGLRNGETYDARLEHGNWSATGFDDSAWRNCCRVNPPGGELQEQTMPPCKVMETIPPVGVKTIDRSTVYDFGQNLSGWCRLRVTGESGTEVRIAYGERLDSAGNVDQSHITKHVPVPAGQFQTDRYILKGEGVEEWEPRFTYHGFQYAQVYITGAAEISQLDARFVYTAFCLAGSFTCSDDIINRLQECTLRSYKGNFVGIPTDCPHREKNGWTGDAQLAAETGLFNFAAASSYAQWIDSIVDTQRPSGQLPGIVPSCGWGYNWGSGPAWDSVLILIPWYVYLYTGDSSIIRTHYEAMKKYVGYCTYMANDHIAAFGLGDWCHVNRERSVDRALTDTGYYYADALLLSRFAAITGRDDDRRYYSELATEIKQAFNRRFYHGDGLYAKGEQTAMACALYHGLVEEKEKAATVKRLVDVIEANGGKLDFGILGAKYVPRVLADHGYAELAYRLITQSEFPGWVNCLHRGATTLWEDWQGENSLNHIMFGDISAWFYQYLAGITPDPENPGFKHFFIRPNPVGELSWVGAEYRCQAGIIAVNWKRTGNTFTLDVQVPEGTHATVIMPDEKTINLAAGTHRMQS